MTFHTTLLGRLRDPAYTGANRCLPCTAVNLVLTAALAGAVAVVSPPAAVIVAAVGVAAVALRGYLVPGTPTLTKRYLPDRVLRWFDKAPTGDTLDGIDPEAYLRDAGALELTPDGDLTLTPWLRRELTARVDDLGDDADLAAALANTLGLDPASVRVAPGAVGYSAWVDRQPAGRWESRVALATDLAADAVLGRRVGGWRALPGDARGSLLGALRLCLDTCPNCDGDVELGNETAESCCRTYEVVAANCDGCGARLFEIDASYLAGDDATATPA
jgi:hypothetical protein